MRRILILAAILPLASVPAFSRENPAPAPGATTDKPADKPGAPGEKPAAPADKPGDEAEKKNPPVAAGPDGFVIQSEKGDFKIQVRGLVQFDGRFYPADDDKNATNNFLVRRARPIVQGSAGKYFEFNLTPDFGGGSVVIQDAYFEVKASPAFRIRVGKFKPPIGLEHLQSDPVLPFAERAYASTLLPSRDVGFQFSGELARGVVSYAAGVFDGAPDAGSADQDTNDSKDVVGRLVLSPFKNTKSFLKDLGLGVGAEGGKETGALASYRSGGQIAIVAPVSGLIADGSRTRLSPELSLYSGPVGVTAELSKSRSRVRKTASAPVTDFEARAFQATAVFALTGEAEAYGGIKVKKSLDPSKGQWGAVEIVARVNGLEIDSDTVAEGLVDPTRSVTKAFAWALGVNWSLTRNLKQYLSYERTTFTRGGGAHGDRPPENAVLFRSQIYF